MTTPLPKPPSPSLKWAYFLDVDGTLINIADTPEAVIVDRDLLDLIRNLYQASGGAMALVSGRMISDLDRRFGLTHLPMAGLHGLERRDSTGRHWTHGAAFEGKRVIMNTLTPILRRHPGLLLEDKGVTLALHYRQARHLASYVNRLMGKFATESGQGLELQRGKFVVEIKPAGVDKGSAVAAYMQEQPFKGRCPVFIGDDLNDEHGFAEVNKLNGVAIKVGKGASCARFRLPDVMAVHQWLGVALKDMA